MEEMEEGKEEGLLQHMQWWKLSMQWCWRLVQTEGKERTPLPSPWCICSCYKIKGTVFKLCDQILLHVIVHTLQSAGWLVHKNWSIYCVWCERRDKPTESDWCEGREQEHSKKSCQPQLVQVSDSVGYTTNRIMWGLDKPDIILYKRLSKGESFGKD